MKNSNKIKLAIYIAIAVVLAAFVAIVISRKYIFPTDSFMYNLYESDMAAKLSVRFMKTVVILCVGTLIIFASKLVVGISNKETNNTVKTVTILVGNVLKYVSIIGMILTILSAFGIETTALVTGASVLTLIVGLGCQSLVSDVVAGLFMLFEGDIKVGDIVVINGWRGTVKQIGLRRTKIEDAVGNINIVNNSSISNIINNTRNLSVAACEVGIEYSESIQRVESVLSKNIDRIKKNIPAIVEGPFYKGVSALAESSVNIKLVAKCKEDDKYQVERDLNREIKIIFDENNINIPYNQLVLSYRDDANVEEASHADLKNSIEFVKAQKELSKNIEEQDK